VGDVPACGALGQAERLLGLDDLDLPGGLLRGAAADGDGAAGLDVAHGEAGGERGAHLLSGAEEDQLDVAEAVELLFSVKVPGVAARLIKRRTKEEQDVCVAQGGAPHMLSSRSTPRSSRPAAMASAVARTRASRPRLRGPSLMGLMRWSASL